jgi:hypothetical protein
LRDEDLRFEERGVVIHIRRSKEDQSGVGAYVGIPNAEDPELCSVRALRRWLAARGANTTYVFPGIAGQVVSNRPYSVSVAGRMVKARTGELGIPGDWGTHSMGADSVLVQLELGQPSCRLVPLRGTQLSKGSGATSPKRNSSSDKLPMGLGYEPGIGSSRALGVRR